MTADGGRAGRGFGRDTVVVVGVVLVVVVRTLARAAVCVTAVRAVVGWELEPQPAASISATRTIGPRLTKVDGE